MKWGLRTLFDISSTQFACGRKEQNRIAVRIGFIFGNDASHRTRILHTDVCSEWD